MLIHRLIDEIKTKVCGFLTQIDFLTGTMIMYTNLLISSNEENRVKIIVKPYIEYIQEKIICQKNYDILAN